MESARLKPEQTESEPVADGSQTLTQITTNPHWGVALSDARPPAVQLRPVVRPSHAVIPPAIQTKLTVNEPGDQYEQEADRMADQVMRMPDSNFHLQRKRGYPAGGPDEPCMESVSHSAQLRRSVAPVDMSSSAEPPAIVHDTLRSPGQALDTSTRAFFEARFRQDFGHVRVHTDAHAAASARAVNALAYAVGPNVVFGAGQYAPQTSTGSSLLAHELAHVAQMRHLRLDATRPLEIARADHAAERDAGRIADLGGSPFYRPSRPLIFRAVVPRPVARLTAAQIFGVGPGTGLSLSEFSTYTHEEADWFVEPTLAVGTNRQELWRLLMLAGEGPHILSGVGDVKLSELRAVPIADWQPLRAFCRGTHSSGNTVLIFPPLPPLADRIALGRTLLDLEALIPPAVLRVTVSHSQLLRVQTLGLMPILRQYWTDYQPHIEQTFSPAAGAVGPEFDRVLTFLISLGAPGLAPLLPLRGPGPAPRWVRNLHRFPLPMLQRLVANLLVTSGAKRLVLVLHTGHDAPGAFQLSANLFSNLVLNSPNNLVLMIEGAASVAAITARIPTITSTWGELVGGVRRISQVLIAGHGSAETVGLAGTGAPVVNAEGEVRYPEDNLDISSPAARATTQALLDALLTRMPPAAARILFAGCLVGSTHVAAGTPAAAIPGALAAHQSLGQFTEARASVAGIPAGRVQAARASVGLSAATSLFNPVTGQLGMVYPFDPNAFASANTYASTGREPEGVLRAAVEVGAVNALTAANLLRTRLLMPALPDWYDTVTRFLVRIAVPVAGGVNLQRVNELANVAQIPFLVHWNQYNITVAHFTNLINPQAFALDIYTAMAATTPYTNPTAAHTEGLRIIVDQGWIALQGAARLPAFLAGILATGQAANAFQVFLSPGDLAPHAAALLPVVGVPSTERIRLALAWYARDRANAQVRSFLTHQVQQVPNVPAAFTPAVRAEVVSAGQTEREILDDLGFGQTSTAPPGLGGAAQPFANLALGGSATRTLLVTGRAYLATVIAVPNTIVRRNQTVATSGFMTLSTGATVQVTGVSGGWAAVDAFGQLGFINQADLTPPPP